MEEQLTSGCCLLTIALGIIVVILYVIFDSFVRRQFIPDVPSKYVLVTGCDSGFGERTCEKLESLGCNVIAACLTDAGVTKIQNRHSRRFHAIKLDVTDEASIQRAVETVSKLLPEGKGLWGIINNAGISGELGPIEWLDRSGIEKLLQINVLGMVSIVRSFLPLMKKSGSGRIVNTASILGRVSVPFAAPYSMSKYAVEAFSDALRIELLVYRIKVAIIEPGGHKTPFLDQIAKNVCDAWNKLPESKKQEYGENYLKQVLFLGTKLIPFLGSTDLNPVVDAYCHALFSERPRTRYMIGFDAYAMHLLNYLPTAILDKVWVFAIWLSTKFE